MRISLRNSKKCLIADANALLAVAALGAVFCGSLSRASTGPVDPIEKEIRAELKSQAQSKKSHSFEALLSRWQKDYGTRAVQPLLSLASDLATRDPERYVALMGATKLGGSTIAAAIVPFLKDPSWMIRSGGLRALEVLNNSETVAAPLPLLKDPALVVRVEAVEAVRILKPPGAADALAKAATAPENFHGGKAQWVPQRALDALVELKGQSAAPKLLPLLNHRSDRAIQKKTVQALEQMTGKVLKANSGLDDKVKAWKVALGAR